MLGIILIFLLVTLCMTYYWKNRYLYLHSTKVPGPISFPIIGTAYIGRGTQTEVLKRILKVFDTYPDILKCWMGPYLVYALTKPEYIEIVLNHSGACGRTVAFTRMRDLWGEGLLSASVPVWRRHRRIIAPSFNTKLLYKFTEIFAKNSEILVEKLESVAKDGPIDIFKLAANCTLDTVSESLFASQIDVQINNKAYGVLFSKWLDIFFIRLFKPWFYSDFVFKFSKYYDEQNEYINEIHKLAKSIIQRKQEEYEHEISMHNEEDGKWKPLLEHLLTSKKHELNRQEIEDEILTFMLAGTDTTATTISFAMLLLGLNQDVQEQLLHEATEVLGHHRLVETNDLPNLKYTKRVIKETLRLFPPVPMVGREVTQDIAIDDSIIIPKGTQVLLAYIHVHRNPKYWPDPLRFDPNRFLPEEIEKRHPCTWTPFSVGMRNCIGGKLAMMLLQTVLVTMVRRFKIETGYERVEDVELETSIVIKPKDGYKIYLTPR